MTRIDGRSVDERIPITLLTGFLGAGKTTLVNRLLSAPDAGKIAVIVNEFGEIGIDGDLIARANEDMLELTNGCICCAAQGDLMDGLNRLFLRKIGLAEPRVDFDKIVIETTGIADPSPLARLFYTDMKLDLTFRLDAVLTVVDLKHVTGQIARSPEAQKQIAIADKLIFNKRDLVDGEAVHGCRDGGRAAQPLLGQGGHRRTALCRWTGCSTSTCSSPSGGTTWWAPGSAPTGRIPPINLSRDDHVHTPGVGAVCLQSREPLEWNALLRFFLELTEEKGEDLFRVKGMVHFQNVEKPVIIQGVQATFSPPTYAEAWPRGEVATRIVVIGRDLDRASMEARFAACVAKRETTLDRGLGAI